MSGTEKSIQASASPQLTRDQAQPGALWLRRTHVNPEFELAGQQESPTRSSQFRGPCVPQLVRQRAAAAPDALAVASGTGTLTYAELNRRAGQLARQFRKLG